MAGTYTFHSKLHRASHHTISGTALPDAGLDPIASQTQPFIGVFFNTIPDSLGFLTINTNSYQWWTTYASVSTLSGIWAPSLSLYNTVNTLSTNWNLGYVGYSNYSQISSLYVSVYTTVSTFSADWNAPFIMFTNLAQEYTAAKTFSGTDLKINSGTDTVIWDVSSNQVTFITLSSNLNFANPLNHKKGGNYTLNVIQSGAGGYDIRFSTAYRFNNTIALSGVISTLSGSRTIINFMSDGTLLYGDRVVFLE